jgi:hypothetical protein
VKRKLVILIGVVALALSQLACGNMTNESRTIYSLQTLVDQQVLKGDE